MPYTLVRLAPFGSPDPKAEPIQGLNLANGPNAFALPPLFHAQYSTIWNAKQIADSLSRESAWLIPVHMGAHIRGSGISGVRAVS
jgi:hypothetical protein